MKHWPGKEPVKWGLVEAMDPEVPAMFYQGEWFRIGRALAATLDRIAEPNHRKMPPDGPATVLE
jgi:hypothetical protein